MGREGSFFGGMVWTTGGGSVFSVIGGGVWTTGGGSVFSMIWDFCSDTFGGSIFSLKKSLISFSLLDYHSASLSSKTGCASGSGSASA